MSRNSKAELNDIHVQLSELDGSIRALEVVLMHQIFESDSVHRHHADSLVLSIERDISTLPRVPPNEALLAALQRLTHQIRNMAAENHQRLAALDS